MAKKGRHEFSTMKTEGEKVTWVTAYDFPTARFAQDAGIDMILVGDSLGMVVYGYADTIPVTMDECIIHYVRTAGTGLRTVAIDANNDIWVGGYSNKTHEKIDGTTGQPVAGTQFNLGCGGYGGLLDGNGVLWSASLSNLILRIDTADLTTGACISIGRTSYGLGIDTNGNICFFITFFVSDI